MKPGLAKASQESSFGFCFPRRLRTQWSKPVALMSDVLLLVPTLCSVSSDPTPYNGVNLGFLKRYFFPGIWIDTMCVLGGQLFQSSLYSSCSRFQTLWNSKLCRELGLASLLRTGPKSHLLTLGGITRSAPALRTKVPAENPQGLWPSALAYRLPLTAYRLVFGFFFCFWLPGISFSSLRSMYSNIYLCRILSWICLCV